MNTRNVILISLFTIALIAGAIIIGCEYISPLPSNTVVNTTYGDTTYVEVSPQWGGFTSPGAIMVGRDLLIYVADYAQNEIVMLDARGVVLKRRHILHPTAIAQDAKLDLLVGGESIAPNGIDTVGTVFRISLVRFDTVYQYGIRVDPFTGDTIPLFRDTSYYYSDDLENAPMRITWQEAAHPARRFRGIGVLPDSEYLVARNGPDNTSFVDPDTRVMLFKYDPVNFVDRFETPLGDLTTRSSDATGITDIRDVTGLMVFPSSRDFVLTQSNLGNAYGALWMTFQSNANFEGWLPKFDPTLITVDFTVNGRFKDAVAATYDPKRRELFVLDAVQDSVIKFNAKGQFKTESFGHYRSASSSFPGLENPQGIAFSSDCTLYISDAGHQVVRRFKLSAQTGCQ